MDMLDFFWLSDNPLVWLIDNLLGRGYSIPQKMARFHPVQIGLFVLICHPIHPAFLRNRFPRVQAAC